MTFNTKHGPGRLVRYADELPALPLEIDELFLDFETSSNDSSVRSTNPWRRKNCSVIGAAVTWDDCPCAWFVPRELLLNECGMGWLADLVSRSRSWVNHNVKYDAHVLYLDLGIDFVGELICTLAQTKIYDADRSFRGGYGLDALSLALLDVDISEYETRMQPWLPKDGPIKLRNKDYGRIPLDLLAEYACVDVLACRALRRFLQEHMPVDCAWVSANEIKLTRALVAMERRGLLADEMQVKLQTALALKTMMDTRQRLSDLLGGFDVLPTSSTQCYDLFCNRLCYPHVYEGEVGRGNDDETRNISAKRIGQLDEDPEQDEEEEELLVSFDRDTLKYYEARARERKSERELEIVHCVQAYRKASHAKGLFWDPWLELGEYTNDLAGRGCVLHSDYNQNVRSGRTSCKTPNAQQLDYNAKTQVRARDGRRLLCWDYSQLEYRWMIHYLQNPAAVKAYNEDPKTDYHQWVADVLCKARVKRRPAKTLNFTIGFGGGKARVTRMLTLEAEIIAACEGDHARVRQMAASIVDDYHKNLPELKRAQQQCEAAVLKRDILEGAGYVKTLYERRLHLPTNKAYKGFNRVVQSTAADNAKEATVMVSREFNPTLDDLDVNLIAQVHDEYLFDVPDDEDVIMLASAEITRCLEYPSHRCRVPIVAHRGAVADTWALAKPE